MKANETYFYRKQLSILAFNRSIADAFLREFIKTFESFFRYVKEETETEF